MLFFDSLNARKKPMAGALAQSNSISHAPGERDHSRTDTIDVPAAWLSCRLGGDRCGFRSEVEPTMWVRRVLKDARCKE